VDYIIRYLFENIQSNKIEGEVAKEKEADSLKSN
jgi:hypothetical protein